MVHFSLEYHYFGSPPHLIGSNWMIIVLRIRECLMLMKLMVSISMVNIPFVPRILWLQILWLRTLPWIKKNPRAFFTTPLKALFWTTPKALRSCVPILLIDPSPSCNISEFQKPQGTDSKSKISHEGKAFCFFSPRVFFWITRFFFKCCEIPKVNIFNMFGTYHIEHIQQIVMNGDFMKETCWLLVLH